MKIKLPSFKRNPEKQRALAISRQSAAFYDIAAAKGGMSVRGRNKNAGDRRAQSYRDKGIWPQKTTEPRQKKAKYKPGTLGLSNVSQRIITQYGTWMTRRERKRLAKATKTPLRLFYNGPTQIWSKGRKAQ